jgi:adenosylhomocysteine nucleosidase
MKRLRALLVLCSGVIAPPLSAQPVDLLLVAANDELLQPLVRRLDTPVAEKHGGWTVWTGTLEGKSVALTRTEGDPLNAVAATTLAIRLHRPRLIFVFGISRAHDPSLKSGDIVLSEAFAAFDGMVSPQKKLNSGSNPLEWNRLPHLLMTSGGKEVAADTFPADPTALAAARRIKLSGTSPRIAILGSAPQINREADRIAWLREQWHTSTEDAESAHVAGCAALFGIPVFGVRVVEGSPDSVIAFATEFLRAWK